MTTVISHSSSKHMWYWWFLQVWE